MHEIVVAMVLLSQPDGTPAPEEAKQLAPAIRRVCEVLEIFSGNDCSCMQQDRQDFDFQTDLDQCRRWWAELRGSPPADDVHRLPPVDVLERWMSFNLRHAEYLTSSQVLRPHRASELEGAASETHRLYMVMLHAWRARNAGDAWHRRTHLKAMREAAGDEAYYSGTFRVIPDYVR